MSNVTATKAQNPSQKEAETSVKSKPQRRVLQERTGSDINKAKSGTQKQSSLIGSKGFLQISKDAKSGKSGGGGGGGGLFVFKDENVDVKATKNSPAKSITHAHVQTVLSGDYGSVVDGDVAFYKELAEKRREALDESLKENESLVMENDELRLENAELKSENVSLQESVEKARKITDMLAPILADSDDEAEEEEKKEGTESDEAPTDAKEPNDKDEKDEASEPETVEGAQPKESNQEEH